MLKHLRKVWLAVVPIILLPSYAFADVGAGMMFMGGALILMFLLIVGVEAVVYQWLLQVKNTLLASFVANLITTAIGIFGYGLSYRFPFYLVMPLALLLTIALEALACFTFFFRIGKVKIIVAVIWANILSYIAIVLIYNLIRLFNDTRALQVTFAGVIISFAAYIYRKRCL